MSKEKQIIPELRFPEFENLKGWQKKPFSKLFKIGSGRDYKHLEKGGIPVYGTGGYMLSVNDFLYDGKSACIGRKGTINRPMFLTGKFWTVDTLFYTHTFIDCTPEFVYLLFQNINWLNYNEAGGVPSLSKVIINKIEAYIPEPIEQKKIVNFISSFDTAIEVENEKLNHLKDHKKGLLQQLFPGEGETQPKFRFPEFKNDGDWEISSLSEISTPIFDGTHQTPKYTDKGIPFFSVENIISGRKNKFISREDYLHETRNNKPEFGDVLITRIGNIGTPKVVDWEYEFSVYVTLAVIKKSKKFDPYFLQAYIQSNKFQNEILRRSLLKAAPCKINMDELRKCQVLLPIDKKEQERIANCISTLDELIKLQTERVKALKKHKKGLMQQMFPDIKRSNT